MLLILATGCALSDEEAARQARNSAVADAAADGTTTADAQADTGETPTREVKVIAGLGAPLATLIDRAGVPGLGDNSPQGVEVSADQQGCLEREASGLDPDDLRTLTTRGGFGDLSLAGGAIVTDAISACVSAEFVAERLADSYVTRLGVDESVDPAFASCIANELTQPSGDASGTGELIVAVAQLTGAETTELPRPVSEAADPCGVPHLDQLLVTHYTGEGHDADVASCISFGLLERLSLSDVLHLGGVTKFEEQLSPTLTLDLEELLEGCGATVKD